MYKKTVTYEDFNGVSVTEDLYFHLSRNDMIKLIKEDPEFTDRMKAAFDAEKSTEVFADICNLIVRSYGIKSADGKEFSKKVKGVPLSETFEDTAAYEALLTVIIDGGEDEMAAIMTGIFPKDIWAQAQAEMAKNENQLELPESDADVAAQNAELLQTGNELGQFPSDTVTDAPVTEEIAQASTELTDEQLQTMTTDEIVAYYKAKGL